MHNGSKQNYKIINNEPNLDKRYLKLDNCFVLPHIGSATHETRLAMSMMAVDNIFCFFNKKPENLSDF